MPVGGTDKRLQKAIGALKDSATVNLARIDGDYKELDIAIIKATSQVERPANKEHIRAIFAAISSTRPQADVAYCIQALARRLLMTNSWVRTEDLDDYELPLQLSQLQQHLFRVLGCLGAATHNLLIQPALSLVVSEGIKIYNAFSDGTVCSINKAFWMLRKDASQALRFLELLEACKSLDVGVGEGFIKMELSPASLRALEDHVTGANLQRLEGVGSTWMTPCVLRAQLAQLPQQENNKWLLLSEESDFKDHKIGELNCVGDDNCDNDKEDLNNDNNLAANAEEPEG